MNEIEDDDISLIFGPVPKKSFNRSLATLSLRTNANTPDNGYPIYASATFGSQIIRLQAGNTEFDVIFGNHEAEIVFNKIRTEFNFGPDYEKHVSIRNEPIKTENSIAEKRNVGISVAPTDIKASSSNSTEFISKNTMDKLPTSFDHARLEFVKIGK